MPELMDLPNISIVLSKLLMEAGVDSPQTLKDLGTKEAFMRVKMKDPTACFCKLCAIEGAIQGVRWHHLEAQVKNDLRAFFDSLKN